MTEAIDTGRDIVLVGNSGEKYYGKIYDDKNAGSEIAGRAIACLTNSTPGAGDWEHHMNSIYITENASDELVHFRGRDDIAQLILLPYYENDNGVVDKVDDLIRRYIHG